MALGITAGVLLIVGFTLFVHGALWWLGLVIAVIALSSRFVDLEGVRERPGG